MTQEPTNVQTEGKQVLIHEQQPIEEQQQIQDVNVKIVEREKARQLEEEKKRKALEESKINVLILGSRHLQSHIIHRLRMHAKFTVIDRVDPDYIYMNPITNKSLDRSFVRGFQFSEHDLERNMVKLLNVGSFDFIIYGLAVHDELFSNANPNFTQTINTLYTQSIMNALADSNSNAKIVFLGTDKVYGDQGCPPDIGPDDGDKYRDQFKISELDQPKPRGVKAISRYNQECIIKGMCETYGLDYLILRIGNMYGRYTAQDNVLNNMFINGMKNDMVPVYGDAFASRDFVDIEDVARTVYEQVVEKYDPAVWNEIYNIGGCYPTRQYIHGLAYFVQVMLSGNQFKDFEKFTYIKPFMSVKIRKLPARCYEDTREAGIRIWLDCKKAQEKLGYKPGPLKDKGLEWEQSIKNTFMWNTGFFLGYNENQMTEVRKILTASYKVKE